MTFWISQGTVSTLYMRYVQIHKVLIWSFFSILGTKILVHFLSGLFEEDGTASLKHGVDILNWTPVVVNLLKTWVPVALVANCYIPSTFTCSVPVTRCVVVGTVCWTVRSLECAVHLARLATSRCLSFTWSLYRAAFVPTRSVWSR